MYLGSHCSGAYISNQYYDKNAIKTHHSMEEYTLTQYLDIWSQLVFGIRYLDLSIGYFCKYSYIYKYKFKSRIIHWFLFFVFYKIL